MAQAARKPKPPTRRELAQELIDIARQPTIAEALDRMEAIKSELKHRSESEGKFREDFAGIGYVSVSPPAPERTVGEEPKINVDAWQAARQSKRDKLLEEGLVEIVPIVKGAYYGRCEVKLHVQPGS